MQKSAKLFLMIAVLLVSHPGIAAACEQWAAQLVSAQGRVEIQSSGKPSWTLVEDEQTFCPGDRIRTLVHSRASLLLPNQTYISLDQHTVVVFSDVKAEEPSWLELLAGALYARSRTPKPLDIRTPFINAAIKGTEFLIKAGSEGGQVTVFEGEVETSNARGQVVLKDGQTAVAALGEAPRLALDLRPEDSVQWALYFPPLVDYAALQARVRDPNVAEALRLYADGDIVEALAALDRVPDARRDVDFAALYAGLLLSVGRVDEAEPLLATQAQGTKAPAAIDALRSVIALARNRKPEALDLANRAVQTDPATASGWMAQSYARQADFDLEGALESIDHAALLDSNDALVQARRAELLVGLGRWSDARKAAKNAVRINPRNPRAHVVLGFVELMDGDTSEALASFRQGSELDSADPLARFGSGLALVRKGELKEGTAAIETAASLDPGDALIRSYLGKAYYELKRNAVAEKQLDLAKTFDPKDPTPWFYDAIRKHAENRPVEAFTDLQKSIELNGNRAVYRSKLALDDDLAARGAALGRIYQEISFQPRALVESWKSLSEDPRDYTAHRLLSDSYAGLPKYETARVSELLQSQLLQPLNITPVQPLLSASDVILLGSLGPADPSLNEFNPLFQRDRFSLLASGLVGSKDTYSDELVHSGILNDFSYSLGQFHYETQGFRPNNDIDLNIYNAFVQWRVTPELNVQAEYRRRELDRGNLDSIFTPTEQIRSFMENRRYRTESDTYRLGARIAISERSDLLGSFIHLSQEVTRADRQNKTLGVNDSRGYVGEVQYIHYHEFVKTVLGGGYYRLDRFGSNPCLVEHSNGYMYSHMRFPASVNWTFGLNLDVLDECRAADTIRRINPKFGVFWKLTADTVIRGAVFKTLKRSLPANQTLEPTQIAGFNQFFDDFNGTDSSRWGVGLDHRFSPSLYAGFEVSKRDLDVPTTNESETEKWREIAYRTYLLWAPHPRWAATVEYLEEDFENHTRSSPRDTETRVLPVTVSYFDPSGFFAKFRASYFDQQVNLATGPESDDAVFLGLDLGYRLPKRWGIIEVQFQNLLDQSYQYEGYYNRRPSLDSGVPSFLPFPTEFAIFARMTLAF
jgi:tetratricopeptide (TPR) repeat protein